MSNSARYRITHQTRYRYSDPVAICQNQLRMMPRWISHQLFTVECHGIETCIDPEPDVFLEHKDYYGNQVVSFSIESLHRELNVSVRSEVSVHQQDVASKSPAPAWDDVRRRIDCGDDPRWLETQEYTFDSPRIRRGEVYAQYADKSFPAGRPIIDAALDLSKRIHGDFKYDTMATDVNTTTDEAFRLRAGVCQDFAHVQIACLRSIGLPTRYVSGYLRTVPAPGRERLVGADQSHAWISLYAGDQFGWVDFDPTNACLSDTNHIPICIGRDFSEVSPMRGVVLGGGSTDLKVSVDVEPVEG